VRVFFNLVVFVFFVAVSWSAVFCHYLLRDILDQARGRALLRNFSVLFQMGEVLLSKAEACS
jgi:hypothetical protein